MAAAAYLSWVHFLWAAIDPALSVLRNVPYAGPVFAALQEVFRGLLVLLDSAVAIMTPLVSAANVVLYTLQEGAWLSVGAPGGGRLSRLPPEAHSGDSAAAPYQEIWPAVVHAANQAVFARTRGSPLLFKDVADSGKILLNDKDDSVQLARAHMIEIANSARDPWVAYGARWSDPSKPPVASWATSCAACSPGWSVPQRELGRRLTRGSSGCRRMSRSLPRPARAQAARSVNQATSRSPTCWSASCAARATTIGSRDRSSTSAAGSGWTCAGQAPARPISRSPAARHPRCLCCPRG